MKRLSLSELSEKLQRATPQKIKDAVEEIIVDDRELLDQKRAEMETGRRPDGQRIGSYRNEAYRLFKMRLNPLAQGSVDLILTGKTKRGLRVEALGNRRFKIKSNTEYWPKLIEKYGGINQTINRRVFNGLQKRKYGPALNRELKKITGL